MRAFFISIHPPPKNRQRGQLHAPINHHTGATVTVRHRRLNDEQPHRNKRQARRRTTTCTHTWSNNNQPSIDDRTRSSNNHRAHPLPDLTTRTRASRTTTESTNSHARDTNCCIRTNTKLLHPYKHQRQEKQSAINLRPNNQREQATTTAIDQQQQQSHT